MAYQTEIADAIKAIQADVTTIVRGEVELAKAELMPQAKSLGIGAGLLSGAGYFALNGIALLFLGLSALVGYYFAYSLGWHPFMAAFMGLAIMAVVMFVIAGILALVGKGKLAVEGPEATVAQGQAAIEAVKGAVGRGQVQGEAEAEARKAARKDAPSITSGSSTPAFVPPAN
ncbi:MAG TPA: phage holin family protein [Micropruina sp.]|jgi:uncharacterized membrane protein YqjE|nr:phage holin family protein [Micropruina sp.]